MKHTKAIYIAIGFFLAVTIVNYIVFYKPLTPDPNEDSKAILTNLITLKSSTTNRAIDSRFSKIKQTNTQFKTVAQNFLVLTPLDHAPLSNSCRSKINSLNRINQSLREEIQGLNTDISNQREEMEQKIEELEDQIRNSDKKNQLKNWKLQLSYWIEAVGAFVSMLVVIKSLLSKKEGHNSLSIQKNNM